VLVSALLLLPPSESSGLATQPLAEEVTAAMAAALCRRMHLALVLGWPAGLGRRQTGPQRR